VAKPRRTQHRAVREEQKSHEVRKLRGDNNSLKKQVGKLRKKLEHAMAIGASEPFEPEASAPPKRQPAHVVCNCTAPDVVVVQLPTGTMAGCRACGERRKV
jgi:hypothetical protein